ncbi:MAG: hypothetical protein K0R33_3715, partial [Mycobacterium sp.]|nr:hypothetical protein [Mycobacterium sp.]
RRGETLAIKDFVRLLQRSNELAPPAPAPAPEPAATESERISDSAHS